VPQHHLLVQGSLLLLLLPMVQQQATQAPGSMHQCTTYNHQAKHPYLAGPMYHMQLVQPSLLDQPAN
jgi:hypothetical protein